MNALRWINDPRVAVSAAAVLLIVSLTILSFHFSGSGDDVGAHEVYYMDLETGEFFTQRLDALPPVTAPSGGDGVRASLYTCGGCSPDEWFGYLETYTREAKQVYEEEGALSEAYEEDYLVRPLDGDRWVPYYSTAGERVRDMVNRPCSDTSRLPEQCLP